MKIRAVELVRVVRADGPAHASGAQAGSTLSASAAPAPKSRPRRKAWPTEIEVANPMSRFPRFKPRRQLYAARQWPGFAVKITAEDGTWGLGSCAGRPAAAVVADAFAHIIAGEDCMGIEKLWDMMFRVSKPFGTVGIATVALSAVDLALWDLKGKLLGKSVCELLGGPVRERVFTYATGDDCDWYLELGFKAFKLPCKYGPADGAWGLDQNERRVAEVRELIGDDCELMLDCYMAFDVDYAVRLAERLKPYKLRWLEECLIPEDSLGHLELKRRLPWQTLAGGEHFYTHYPYQLIVEHRALDILQPDIQWVGGLTPCLKICHMAEAAGLEVCLHGGARDPYGQHLTFAMPNTPWGEYYIGSDPGIPLAEVAQPGALVPENGYLDFTATGPGFDLGIAEDWLEPFVP